VVVPVGTGLRLRMGKFVNFVGYETINQPRAESSTFIPAR